MARDIKVALELENSKFNRNLATSEKKVDQFSKNSTLSVRKLGVAFAALGGAALIKNVVSIGQTFQDLRTSLAAVTGSVETGNAVFQNLITLATQTQFSVENLSASFIRLKGAGVEPTNDLLLTFANTAAIAQDQTGVLTALTELFARATSKAKLELEDFNKIEERQVGILGILRKEFGMSIRQIQDLAKTAEGQEKLFAGITKALDEAYGGNLEKKLATSSIAFNNLRDAARGLADTVFLAVGLDSTTAVNGLTDAINSLSTNIQNISTDGFSNLTTALATLTAGLVIFAKRVPILNVFSKGMTGLKGSIETIIIKADDLGKSIVGIGIAAKGTYTPMQNLKAIFTNVGNSFKALFGKFPGGQIVKAGAGFTGLAAIVTRLGQSVFSLGGAFAAFGRLALGPIGAVVLGVELLLSQLLGFSILEVLFNIVKKLVIELGKLAGVLLGPLVDGLKSVLGFFGGLITASQEFFAPIKENLEDMGLLSKSFEETGKSAEQLAKDLAKAKEEADKLSSAEYDQLTDNDTLFDMDPQSFDNLQAFSDEIDRSLGGLDEYNRLMKLFNGMFSDPKTIADMEERQAALDDLNNSYASLFDPVDALNDAISDGIADQQEYNSLQAEINRLQELGILSAEDAAQAQRDLDAAFNENTGLQAFISTLNSAVDTLADDLTLGLMQGQDALESFKDFFRTIVNQIIADAIKMLFIIPILEALGFSVGATGAIKGLSGEGFLGKMGFKATGAGGGSVMANRPMLIGEQGMEIFTPSSSGTITPNSQMGTTVNYTINALDTASFESMLSQNPQFVHAVVTKGANSMPSGRRF